MSNSNYPAGVTDAHPHFNPAPERATAVECGADSALVVPSFAVKAALIELTDMVKLIGTATAAYATSPLSPRLRALERIEELVAQIHELEQESEYECPFSDEIDLEESECARWDCPVCGNERETDNAPEDRDPDYEHDRDR